MRKKYAIAGASSRALNMFIQPMVANPELGEIVALFSRHPESAMKIVERSGGTVSVYSDFEAMVKTSDVAIHNHSLRRIYYKAMELGCDVITEKPLTINAEKTNAIVRLKIEQEKTL